ncbi:MAG: CoA transferase [Deltaproteobacteria bacterium]|nr:CoA transferase [Deltaproteobacteria bacterium]
MKALEKLRVVDLSRHAPGPFCTMLLADFGADVVVVEQPSGTGRKVEDELGVGERTRVFNPVGRNKRSIALNLKKSNARDACLRLMSEADIVVEGFRPGVAKRLGVDYESIRERNPGVIYCSVSGYGQDGPYADLVGHDLNYISLGGALGVTGWPGQPPAIPVNIIGDYAGGGLYAAFAVLTAVQARHATGKGQYIDMAMSDGVMSLANLAVSDYFNSGETPRPGRYFLNGSLPCYNVYETADGKWLSIGCMEPWFWVKLCTRLGCEKFAEEQFNEEKFPEIFSFLRASFLEKSRDDWFAELRRDEICVTPVYELDEAVTDPHMLAREMLVELEHPEFGTVHQVGIAPKFSETPGSVRTLASRIGAHTEEVLREANFSAAEIEELTSDA